MFDLARVPNGIGRIDRWWIFILLSFVVGPQGWTDDISTDHPFVAATTVHTDNEKETVILTITDPWPGGAPLRYAIVDSRISEFESTGFDGVIHRPVERVVVLTSTLFPHIDDLGVLDRLIGVDSAAYTYNEEIYHRVRSGQISAVGSGEQIDVEQVIALQPDLVLLSSIGGDDPALARLAAAGIPTIVVADWRESTPLGRAEWIRVVGLLVGREEKADELFTERAQDYREIARRVSRIPDDQRPTVLLNAPWQGSWPVPRGESYIARLFSDAGAHYPWSDTEGGGSLFLDFESVLEQGVTADYWFNLNFGWRTRGDVREFDPRLASFQAYQNRRMYHYTARTRPWGANDFWESGAARPDLVLSDIVRILHPSVLPTHDLVYYTRIP